MGSMSSATRQISGFLKRCAGTVLVLASPSGLYAQGCAMCYQSAAASGPRSIQALKSGILTLMLPPVLITAVIAYLAYRKRDKYNETY
jgi:hypothetical protein